MVYDASTVACYVCWADMEGCLSRVTHIVGAAGMVPVKPGF